MEQAPVEVYDKRARHVPAKMLSDASGNVVRDPITGMPLIVGEDFDMDRAIAFGQSLRKIPALNDNPDVARGAAYHMAIFYAKGDGSKPQVIEQRRKGRATFHAARREIWPKLPSPRPPVPPFRSNDVQCFQSI